MLTQKLAALTRRRLLLAAGAAGAGAAAAAGVSQALGTRDPGVPWVPLGGQPAGLPGRQHAWEAWLARDQYGNPVPPRFHRLLFFDVNGAPTPARARLLEAALRTLERTWRWAPSGLLFTAGWGHAYFAGALRVTSPVPPAAAMSDFELPAIDGHHLCLHRGTKGTRPGPEHTPAR